jgi:hypothetical protein
MQRLRPALFALFALLLVSPACSAQNKMDQFAQCLANKNVSMYGAYWCPHCKDQKDEFKESFKYVHYVECAIPGKPPNIQTDACKDAGIKKYPTWIFPDGERVEAVLPMDKLAEKAGCPAPPPPAK